MCVISSERTIQMSIFEKHLMKQLSFLNLDTDAIKWLTYLRTKGWFFFYMTFSKFVKQFSADEHISILSYRGFCKIVHLNMVNLYPLLVLCELDGYLRC